MPVEIVEKNTGLFLWEEDQNCDRASHLEQRDVMRKEHKQFERCMKRRKKPGFATLDNMRYGGN